MVDVADDVVFVVEVVGGAVVVEEVVEAVDLVVVADCEEVAPLPELLTSAFLMPIWKSPFATAWLASHLYIARRDEYFCF